METVRTVTTDIADRTRAQQRYAEVVMPWIDGGYALARWLTDLGYPTKVSEPRSAKSQKVVLGCASTNLVARDATRVRVEAPHSYGTSRRCGGRPKPDAARSN